MSRIPQLPEAHAWLGKESLPQAAAVAWSGGADSTALLLALRTVGVEAHALHVDHAWHPDSDLWTERLQGKAEAWGIPFLHRRLSAASPRNREAQARRSRYAALSEMAGELGVRILCLAHHADDQAETVCLRMLQGAGIMGVRGMRARRDLDGLLLWRPLLAVPKQALLQALSAAGVEWLEDPSNLDLALWRNRIRHTLFPRMQLAGVEPRDLFLRFAHQADLLERAMQADLGRIPIRTGAGWVQVEWHAFTVLSPSLRAIMLQKMAARLFGAGKVLGRRHILLAHQWLQDGGAGGVDLSRCRLARMDDALRLARPGFHVGFICPVGHYNQAHACCVQPRTE